MVLKDIAEGFKVFFQRCFHKRNIIIVSEHKVKHLHLSTVTQCALLSLTVVLCFGASYYAGQYMAKQSTPAHNLQFVQDDGQPLEKETENALESHIVSVLLPAADKMEKTELIARVAVLEKQVSELEIEKKDIIERVRDKTSGQIDKLERIIKQTGLNPQELRKRFDDQDENDANIGGPYIPQDATREPDDDEQALYDRLDELSTLRQIVDGMPLAQPMKNARMNSGFGRRIDPFSRRMAFHSGVDFSGPTGSRIRATADGVVSSTKKSRSYGNYIDVEHDHELSTRYAHLSRILVRPGQKVKLGDVIGIQGSTGRSTGNHLHYEVRYRNQALNPKRFVEAGLHVSEEE
ncbi:MAG: M23 family metallopeptidase [Alphaproteobacteria bacterium]